MAVLSTVLARVVSKKGCAYIRLSERPAFDKALVEVDGVRYRAKYVQEKVKINGVVYVYHYLRLGCGMKVANLIGRTVEVKLVDVLDAPVRAVAKTVEVPVLPRHLLAAPCAEKVLALLQLAGGCINARTSDIAVATVCSSSTVKAVISALVKQGKVVERGWEICLR